MKAESSSAVLITGTSSGIGRSCALYLDAQGTRVFAGVRRAEDAEALRAAATGSLTPILLDVADPHSIASALKEVEEELGASGLQGLVNNAGIHKSGPLEGTDLDDMRRVFEVNVIGATAVTQAFMPLIRAGHGRIVNIGSENGFLGWPLQGTYTASKFALEGLTDSWRRELRPWGIHVAIIEPGAIESEIYRKIYDDVQDQIQRMPENARELFGEKMKSVRDSVFVDQEKAVSGEIMGRAVSHALNAPRPKFRYRIGPGAKSNFLLCRLLGGRPLDALINRMVQYQ